MATPSTPTPTIAKLASGVLLTRLREASGKTPSEVAAELGINVSTYRRWESGKFAPKPISVKAIAEAVGATPEEMSRMSSLALAAKQDGLFEGPNVPPDLRVITETEATARLIQDIQLEHIPGLLQTPEYHRTVQEALPPIEPERAETLRKLRARRQEIVFGRRGPAKMRFLIGLAALAYLDARPAMRDAQIARLRKVDAMKGVEIRVITGFHAAMSGSFTILTPPDSTGARPFAYVEDIDGGRYVEGDVVSQYQAVFETVGDGQSVELEDYLR